MGIFSRNYDSQVPEEGDLPRKKGVARFFELLGRDLANYFKSGVLAFLGLLPFLIGISFSVSSHAVFPMLVSGVFGGMLAAPQISPRNLSPHRSPAYHRQEYGHPASSCQGDMSSLQPRAVCSACGEDIADGLNDRDGPSAIRSAIPTP